MADTLETLEIEVKHSATGAADEINKVAAAIRSVSRALDKALPNLKVFNDVMGGGSINYTDSRTTQIAETINNVKQAASKAQSATVEAGKGIKSLASAANGAQSPLANFVSSLKRIAFYRFIRSIIKEITQAFQEGLKWAYQFSSGIDGEGGRFADALDRMKSAGTQMKAQLGSAFAGLLAAIEPILQRIIDLITKVADAVSQFFAAFTGTTYLKALPVADKFADTMKQGGAAAKEWKNQLMGFDVINRLNEPSQGGGGSSTGLDPSQMFEDTPLDAWAMKVRNVIEWIRDHMDTIKAIATAIGLAIAAWEVGKFLAGLTGLSPILTTILGIAMAIGGAFLYIKGLCDAWVNGVNWDNLTLMISGVALAAIGLGLAFGGVAAAVALLIGGVGLIVVGLKDFIQTGELTTPVLTAITAGVVAIGAAISLLTGSWIPLLISGIVAGVAWIVANWDEVKEAWENLWSSLYNTIAGWGNAILEWLHPILVYIDKIAGFMGMNWNTSGFRFGGQTNSGSNASNKIFASGGSIPNDGSMFIAGEAGAELVANMGNRTGVMNIDQMREAVRQGVADAMGNGNRDNVVRVYLDGKQISNAVTRNQRNTERSTGVALA